MDLETISALSGLHENQIRILILSLAVGRDYRDACRVLRPPADTMVLLAWRRVFAAQACRPGFAVEIA